MWTWALSWTISLMLHKISLFEQVQTVKVQPCLGMTVFHLHVSQLASIKNTKYIQLSYKSLLNFHFCLCEGIWMTKA